MRQIKTYEDFAALSGDMTGIFSFIEETINEHKKSGLYRTAALAEEYYRGLNPTIMHFQKIIYDMAGMANIDRFSANHKVASSFFKFAVNQENQYLLGNGITLKPEAKEKLGTDFDRKVQKAGREALIGGVSFGFWNLDHLEVYKLTEFVPLYSEENGALMAGIRFWQVAEDKPLRATLFETDGYTEYIKKKGDRFFVLRGKRAYKEKLAGTPRDGMEIYQGENYPGFPIVPLWGNDEHQSELVGKQNTIDALDLATSNMVNNVDEGNLIYWALVNCGAMTPEDDLRFVEQLKVTHVVHAEGDEGAKAEAHTVEAPFSGTQATIDMLTRRLFTDFQCFDSASVSAGNQTATAIKAAYVPIDLKADMFEGCVSDFLSGIFKIAGIEDSPSYTRNKIVNQLEETQMLLMAAQYLDEEYLIDKLLTAWGDADKVSALIDRRAGENLGRLGVTAVEGRNIADLGEVVAAAEEATDKGLNGAQTQSLIQIIQQLSAGTISEGQAVSIISVSIGVSKEKAKEIIRGE